MRFLFGRYLLFGAAISKLEKSGPTDCREYCLDDTYGGCGPKGPMGSLGGHPFTHKIQLTTVSHNCHKRNRCKTSN